MACIGLRLGPNLARYDRSRDRSRDHVVKIRRHGIRAHRRALRFFDLADRLARVGFSTAFFFAGVFFVLSPARLRSFFAASMPMTVTAISPTELMVSVAATELR